MRRTTSLALAFETIVRPEVQQQAPWRKAFPLLFSFACIAHCTDIQAPTRLNITLDAPNDLRERITLVEVQVSGALAQSERTPTLNKALSAETGWPLRWMIARADPEQRRYAVLATASDASSLPIASVRAVGEFRDQETVQLALSFDASCGAPCSDGKTCAAGSCVEPHPTSSEPSAAPGSEPPAKSVDASLPGSDDCGSNHGGCDALTTCKLKSGKPECGACPSGFVGDGERGCAAVLTGLEVTGATLEPAFDPERSDYTLSVGLISDHVSLTPTAAQNTEVRIAGEVVASGSTLRPKPLWPGADTLLANVSAPGHEGRSYHLQVRRAATQTGTILPRPQSPNSHFGHVLAVDGDTLVSSAVDENSDLRGVNPDGMLNDRAKNSGAVHVLRRAGSSWVQEAFLKASDATPGQLFGTSIAIVGNLLIVGAMHDSDVGAVYVFERENGEWRERVKLTAPDRQSGANFGQSVALQGDTLVVGAGALDSSSGLNDIGAAYVWKRGADAASWSFLRRLLPDKPSAYAWFGSSVRLGGRYLVIGATGEGGSGVAYVFDAESFAQRAILTPSAAGAAGFFGQLSAISGETIAVTAFNGNVGVTSGAVYVYVHTHDDEFVQQVALQANNASGGDFFGVGLALSGDSLVVGAAHESSGARGIDGDLSAPAIANSGAAYVFARVAGTFTQIARLKASDAGSSDEFGWDVAISGEDIIVGANNVTGGSGALYLFH